MEEKTRNLIFSRMMEYTNSSFDAQKALELVERNMEGMDEEALRSVLSQFFNRDYPNGKFKFERALKEISRALGI